MKIWTSLVEDELDVEQLQALANEEERRCQLLETEMNEQRRREEEELLRKEKGKGKEGTSEGCEPLGQKG